MFVVRSALAILVFISALNCATFGTAVPLVGGATDLVLDEARARLYLVNSSQNRVEVYSLAQRRFLTPIATDSTPISAAISRSGRFLFVTSYDASSLNVLDLDTLTVSNRVSLPAKPEGVAVGADERVLISTIGTGTGNAANVLLVYDPNAQDSNALSNVTVTPPAPTPPQLPPPSGRQFLASHSQLAASKDGNYIIGVNLPNANSRTVFVYEVVSGTMLRSRNIANASSVLAVAPDGSKFMAGLSLFDTSTLQIAAQQNLANSPYPIAPNTNFNTQTNQGGSVFSQDGAILYSAFDISPVQNPPARANISQLMISDPDNLLISLGLQMPENLAGKMVISSDAANIYALSESGFTIIPISTMRNFPIAVPESDVTLLINDQCGVNAKQNSARINVKNAGRGQMTVSGQVLQYPATGTGGLGGNGGPGGGIVGGGGVVIILPPVVTPAPTPTPGPTVPGGGGQQNASLLQTAPTIRTVQTADGPALDFGFSSFAARALGTIAPSHDILVQSPQAINIPHRIRVYQNNRNAEGRGDVIPAQVGISAAEGLVDLTYDTRRQRLYIANSGMNRVEVFDIAAKQFTTPIKAGQLPRSLALTPDGNTLYVANSGGESISIIDPDQMQVVDRVQFPPIPLNASTALVTPSILAASQRGVMFITSAGQIWRIVGNQAVPRGVSATIGTDTQGRPKTITAPRSMAATPAGEYVLVVGGDGNSYLYSALADDFVQARQVFSGTQQGYTGAISAGARGAYYLVNGMTLNESLTPVVSTPTGAGTSTTAAVAPAGGTTFARFTQPVRANSNTLPSDAGAIDIVDTNTGAVLRSFPALEGPMTQVAGNGRASIDGRLMAVDSGGTTAYVVTNSGLSIIPLDPIPASDRPQVNPKGAVNLASYQAAVAPNTLLSIFGKNLTASTDQASSTPLPTVLGGVCVTLGNTALPLFSASPGQINAQIPPSMAAGNAALVVRSVARKTAAASQTVMLSKYAPAVLVDPVSGQIALFHKDGSAVNKNNPAHRDEPLTLYALGLGVTKGGAVTAGNGSPSSPLAVTDKVEVFFGNPSIKEAGIIVDWSGLTPGMIGLYQLNLRVPGAHINGDALPVTVHIGTVSSPTTGPVVPVVAVE
jgi:uncharacterized protein (TIGR03437 family)